MLLDEVRLEQVRLGDAVGEYVLETLGAFDHTDVADLEARSEVRTHAVAEDVRLSDVEHAALRILE